VAQVIHVTVCTANPHKLEEFRALFPDWDLELLDAEPPPEDGLTFADNARIKARFGRLTGPADRWMLADDSGIEVAALGGGPGVLTARWAEGRHVEKLLAALEGKDDRSARYVCELVAIAPDGREIHARGELAGTLAAEPRGTEGFGYDPAFVPEGESRTVAEMRPQEKDAISHRSRAAAELLELVDGAVGRS
jgi:XTP/dITP diphosphohydrolase